MMPAMVRQIAIEREDDPGIPLLQKSEKLLGNGVIGSPEVWLTFNESRPLREADMGAVKKVLATLDQILQKRDFEGFRPVVYKDIDTNSEETFLHLLFWKSNLDSGTTAAMYKQACEAVLETLESWSQERGEKAARVKMLLNMRDGQGRTVLHHATLKWGRKVVSRLLKMDADLCIGDVLGELPVARISPVTLERFLDSKWHPRGEDDDDEEDPDQEEYTVTFDFAFLSAEIDSSDSGRNEQTRVLAEVAKSAQHRHLLTHPVLSTFLARQWEHISTGYTLATIFSLFVCLTTTIFVLAMYGGNSVEPLAARTSFTSCSPSWTSSTFPSVLESPGLVTCAWVALILSTLGLVVKELLQMAVACRHNEVWEYLTSLENWMELAFIACSSMLCISAGMNHQLVCTMRSAAAISLLTSWVLLFNMLARNPNFHRQNIHLTMFFKVMQMFVKIFLIFAPYIFGFGLFFYISLHNDDVSEPKEETGVTDKADTCSDIRKEIIEKINEKGDEKGEFLDKVGFSVLKTLAMFVGELEFSDIPFDNVPYFSHVAFLIFVFLIVVVLMNLLTGLAVGETNLIQSEAAVCAQEVRLSVVQQAERISLLLGGRFPYLGLMQEETTVRVKVKEDICSVIPWCQPYSWRSELRASAKRHLRKAEEEEEAMRVQVEVVRRALGLVGGQH